MSIDQYVNTLFCGDNLPILKQLPNHSIDVVYIDPPFCSDENYTIIHGNGAEIRQFTDRWASSLTTFLPWMEDRLVELHRILKSTGMLFVHCDYHADAYLRVLCDKIFGMTNLKSVIIWKRYPSVSATPNGISTITDTILLYAKDADQCKVMAPRQPLDSTKFDKIETETGRRFKLTPLIKSGSTNHSLRFNGKLITLNSTQRFVWSQEKLDSELERNPLCIYWSDTKVPYYKSYEDEHEGSPQSNLWIDIPGLGSNSDEKFGYPTQKPKTLLKRILRMSSAPNDVILDAFMGSGTTIDVAKELGRQWIGIDVSPVACRIAASRIHRSVDTIQGMPRSSNELNDVNTRDFHNTVIRALVPSFWDREYANVIVTSSSSTHITGTVYTVPFIVCRRPITQSDAEAFVLCVQKTPKQIGLCVSTWFASDIREYLALPSHRTQIHMYGLDDLFHEKHFPIIHELIATVTPQHSTLNRFVKPKQKM